MKYQHPATGIERCCKLFGKTRHAYYDYIWRMRSDLLPFWRRSPDLLPAVTNLQTECSENKTGVEALFVHPSLIKHR